MLSCVKLFLSKEIIFYNVYINWLYNVSSCTIYVCGRREEISIRDKKCGRREEISITDKTV